MLRTFSVQHRDTDILRVWFILSEATSRTSVDAYCFPWPLECASNLCRYIVTFLCRQGVSLNVSFTGVEIPSQVRRILPALNASAWCFWSPSIIQTSGRHGGVKLSHVSSKTQSSSSWIKMMLLASSLLLNNNHQANTFWYFFDTEFLTVTSQGDEQCGLLGTQVACHWAYLRDAQGEVSIAKTVLGNREGK